MVRCGQRETERQEWEREDTGVGEREEGERQECERDRRETGVGERKIKRDSGWETER